MVGLLIAVETGRVELPSERLGHKNVLQAYFTKSERGCPIMSQSVSDVEIAELEDITPGFCRTSVSRSDALDESREELVATKQAQAPVQRKKLL